MPGSPPGDNPFSFLQADDKPGIFLTARGRDGSRDGAPSMRHPCRVTAKIAVRAIFPWILEPDCKKNRRFVVRLAKKKRGYPPTDCPAKQHPREGIGKEAGSKLHSLFFEMFFGFMYCYCCFG